MVDPLPDFFDFSSFLNGGSNAHDHIGWTVLEEVTGSLPTCVLCALTLQRRNEFQKMRQTVARIRAELLAEKKLIVLTDMMLHRLDIELQFLETRFTEELCRDCR